MARAHEDPLAAPPGVAVDVHSALGDLASWLPVHELHLLPPLDRVGQHLEPVTHLLRLQGDAIGLQGGSLGRKSLRPDDELAQGDLQVVAQGVVVRAQRRLARRPDRGGLLGLELELRERAGGAVEDVDALLALLLHEDDGDPEPFQVELVPCELLLLGDGVGHVVLRERSVDLLARGLALLDEPGREPEEAAAGVSLLDVGRGWHARVKSSSERRS